MIRSANIKLTMQLFENILQVEVNQKDYANCPFCQSEKDGVSQPWGMSPEGMQALREKHDRGHRNHCKECGQPI